MLRAAGARRVAFHLGTPWPPGWRSSGATRAELLDTFAHLADADVLLTAVSGFSKAAAHYSPGVVLHLSGAQPHACPAATRHQPGAAECLHRLPPPPRCTASTEARLRRIVQEAAA